MSVRVRIPFMPKSEQAQPLQDAIHHAAQQMGTSDHFAANLMTFFLEGIADEISKGEVVRIPGFGIFAPYGYTPRMKGLDKRCLPSFTGARAFRNTLTERCPYGKNRNHEISTYRRSNNGSSGAKSATSRVFTAMKAFRERVDAQAKRLGIKARPTGILPA